MKRKPKIGDRVRFQSLDETIAPTFGKIVELSPSGARAEVEWDDGETYTYDLTDNASCVRLVTS
jgi:hypothetical protein